MIPFLSYLISHHVLLSSFSASYNTLAIFQSFVLTSGPLPVLIPTPMTYYFWTSFKPQLGYGYPNSSLNFLLKSNPLICVPSFCSTCQSCNFISVMISHMYVYIPLDYKQCPACIGSAIKFVE